MQKKIEEWAGKTRFTAVLYVARCSCATERVRESVVCMCRGSREVSSLTAQSARAFHF